MPFSLNPLHYVLLLLIILLLGISTYAWTMKERFVTLSSRYNAFVAETEATANAQKVKNLEEKAEREEITSKLSNDNVKLQTDLDKSYAEYNRLRNTKAGSSRVPALSSAAEAITCPEADESRLSRSLERLESSILERLARSRDEAINNNLLCSSWLHEQLAVK